MSTTSLTISLESTPPANKMNCPREADERKRLGDDRLWWDEIGWSGEEDEISSNADMDDRE